MLRLIKLLSSGWVLSLKINSKNGTEIINDFCCNMMRQDGYGNEQLKWYQWTFHLTKMDWQTILNWSCCPNTNGEEPLVNILCLFHELRYLNCNVYAYFSSVMLDRHKISSDSACTWSSSEVLRDAIQARGVGRPPKYHTRRSRDLIYGSKPCT